MNLFRESWEAVRWAGKVSAAFFAVRPWTTAALVLAIAIGRFANLLAFFLPLKVILLAGAAGVPRYFRFFIEPDDKMGWIIGLSIGAVGFYMLSLLMNSASRALSQAGSLDVLQDANEIAATSRQREEARGYYARFSSISANGLIVLIGSLVLALMNPLLLVVLGCFVLLQFLFSALIVGMGDPIQPSATLRMIRANLNGYLDIFYSINFLAGFFVLLAPFLMGVGGNLLLAILSILIMRQGLGALSSGVIAISKLWRNKEQVNPMVFRDHQIQRRERLVTRNLRQVFEKKDRVISARSQLNKAGKNINNLQSEWRDSTIPGVYTFRLQVEEKEGGILHYQQQVFPKSALHMLEHEEFLFTVVRRDVLKAPPVLARFEEGPFSCQICEYGEGSPIDSARWKETELSLHEHFWKIRPPRDLVDAYRMSKPLLHERVKEQLLERLEIALNDSLEERLYFRFIERLPEIQRAVGKVPLYISNPDAVRLNTFIDASGEARVLTWGRWALEPIGASLPNGFAATEIESMLERVKAEGKVSESWLSVDHVKLVSDFRFLEREILKGRYQVGVKMIERILRIMEKGL